MFRRQLWNCHYYVVSILLCVTCVSSMIFQGKFKPETEERVSVTIQDNGRWRRSPEDRSTHPKQFDVSFTAFSDDVILPLVRNDDINQNIPVYVTIGNHIAKQQIPDLQNAALYQNIEKGAAFYVEFNDTIISNLFGSLHLNDEEYILERDDHVEPFQQNQPMGFKLFKSKKMNLKYGDYILKDVQSGVKGMKQIFDHKLQGRDRIRNKRATTAQQVELLIVTDFSVYQYWYDESSATTSSERDIDAKVSIVQFYAFVINAVDVRYKSVQSSKVSISVLFAGIYISDSAATSTWTENIKISAATTYEVDADTALSNFRLWEQSTSDLPDHDHAMLFTKYDFTSNGDNGIAGLAYVGGICDPFRQSIVEDIFNFGMMTVAAHELGHNLGAAHDGTRNSCSFDDGFVMAASTNIKYGDLASNPWKFSNCSVEYFEDHITFLDNSGTNCLTTLGATHDPTALTPYDQQVAGQFYDPDTQCQHIEGDSSYLCRGFYYQDYSSICNRMYCAIANSDRCSENFAADGTTCGDKKWCMKGACVSNSSAPTASDICPFGDQSGIIGSGHTCESVVQLNAYNCNNTAWYGPCCSTCGALYTGVPGCEYGDQSSQCDAVNCPFYTPTSLAICCQSCAVTTTTVTPPTTTTTPTTTATTSTTTPTTTTTTTTTTTPTTTTTSPTTTTTTTTPTTTTTSPTTTTTTTTPTTTTTTTTTTTPTTTTTSPTTTTTTTTPTTTTTTTTTTTPTTTTSTTTPATTTTTPTATTTTTPTTTSTTTTTTPTTTTSTTTPTITITTPITTTTTSTTTTPTTTTTTPTTAIPTTTITTPTTTTTTLGTTSAPDTKVPTTITTVENTQTTGPTTTSPTTTTTPTTVSLAITTNPVTTTTTPTFSTDKTLSTTTKTTTSSPLSTTVTIVVSKTTTSPTMTIQPTTESTSFSTIETTAESTSTTTANTTVAITSSSTTSQPKTSTTVSKTTTSPTTTSTPTTTSVSTATPATSTAQGNTTTQTDKLLEMLVIGVGVGVAGVLVIVLISVGLCLTCRRVQSKNSSNSGPTVDDNYIPDMYDGKTPIRTPVMFNSPHLSTSGASIPSIIGNGRIGTPAPLQSHSSRDQRWYPAYGGYTNYGMQDDTPSNAENYLNPNYTENGIRGQYNGDGRMASFR